ncbi:C40 family peptidase [Rhodococcus coprophilus]|uniref:Peptidase n=1 Tax=Rhodococcus coprophilus TaxID=38310 RepID=A0A2X4U220_9NOCA|nr:C40 family peptidase [Rhodococcus coprophilus]MBM7460462.1 cell wall-associated NlpC family hydrolase [Rhodococcus coprophilus]SQI28272.1 peptidase [Rhodococcus coprophilus]
MVSHNNKRTVRRALVAGAIALGAVTVSAGPAAADPVNIPGVGTFDLPAGVSLPPEVADLIPQQPSAAPTPAAYTAPFTSVGQRAADAAQSKIGAPYVYGAAGPNSFDCSGLVQWAYQQAGVNVPRTSYDQAVAGQAVSISDLQPGDVVSFYGGSHTGIYIGGGNIVHASTSSQPVKVAPLDSMPVDGARRF